MLKRLKPTSPTLLFTGLGLSTLLVLLVDAPLPSVKPDDLLKKAKAVLADSSNPDDLRRKAKTAVTDAKSPNALWRKGKEAVGASKPAAAGTAVKPPAGAAPAGAAGQAPPAPAGAAGQAPHVPAEAAGQAPHAPAGAGGQAPPAAPGAGGQTPTVAAGAGGQAPPASAGAAVQHPAVAAAAMPQAPAAAGAAPPHPALGAPAAALGVASQPELAIPLTGTEHESASAWHRTRPQPLLDPTPCRLPGATLGVPYTHFLRGVSGQPPYHYHLDAGRLADGLELQPDGCVTGTPRKAGSFTFTVRLVDAAHEAALQEYRLGVGSRRKGRPAAPASVPLTIDEEDAEAILPSGLPTFTVYQLQPDIMKQLVPPKPPKDEGASGGEAEGGDPAAAAPAGADPAAGDGTPDMDDIQIGQLKVLLAPLVGVEFPSRQLFEAALDAQVCDYARTLVQAAAKKAGKPKYTLRQLATIHRPNWTALGKRTLKNLILAPPTAAKAKTPAPAPVNRVALEELPTTLMSYEVRQWLVAKAAQTHPLVYTTPVAWDGRGTGTAMAELTGTIYGFYPFWWAQNQPHRLDFGVLHRVSLFAFPFEPDGRLGTPATWTPDQLKFIAEADQHLTQVDFTLFREDWTFLRGLSVTEETLLAEKLAQNARALLDTPMPGFLASLRHLLPVLGSTPRFGSGLTLWLEPPADPDLRKRFDGFYLRLVEHLSQECRKGARAYTLNLMVPEQHFGEPGCFEMKYLLHLIQPKPADLGGRKDNLTVRFIVPLPDPSDVTEKQLRAKVETGEGIGGADCRTLLRRIIPMLSPVGVQPEEMRDNLVYIEDNFGGVAFWPLPIQGLTGVADLRPSLLSAFCPPRFTPPSRVLMWVAEHRWPLRVLFDTLVLLLVAALVGLFTSGCRRNLGGPGVKLGLLGGLVVTVVLGAFLLNGDPDVTELREGNALLWILVAVLTLGALFVVLRPRVEKP